MIVLAVLEWLASKCGGEVGKQWFYESDPIDPDTGKPNADGVYGVSVAAPRGQGEDYHQFVGLYVVIAKTVGTMPPKQATDSLADSIEDAVVQALDDPTSYVLTETRTGAVFDDVRITPSSGKNTMEILANGAVVKHLEIEIYYKKED